MTGSPRPRAREEQGSAPAPTGTIVSSRLVKVRRRGRITLASAPPPAPPPPVHRPAKLAQLLALAHHIEALIERGAVADRADVARKLGLTRARVTQILDLTLLAPDIQEQILFAEAVDGREPFTERDVRPLVLLAAWAQQREAWRAVTCRRAPAQPPAGARTGGAPIARADRREEFERARDTP